MVDVVMFSVPLCDGLGAVVDGVTWTSSKEGSRHVWVSVLLVIVAVELAIIESRLNIKRKDISALRVVLLVAVTYGGHGCFAVLKCREPSVC